MKGLFRLSSLQRLFNLLYISVTVLCGQNINFKGVRLSLPKKINGSHLIDPERDNWKAFQTNTYELPRCKQTGYQPHLFSKGNAASCGELTQKEIKI